MIDKFPDFSATSVSLRNAFGSLVVGTKRPAKKEVPTPVHGIECSVNPLFAIPTHHQLTQLLLASLYEKVSKIGVEMINYCILFSQPDAPFCIVDFFMHLENLIGEDRATVSELLEWAEKCIFTDSDKLETKLVALFDGKLDNVSVEEMNALHKWRQVHPEESSLDSLNLRQLECYMLWIISCYHLNYLLCQLNDELSCSASPKPADFKRLLQVLASLAEAAGLIKSLLGDPELDNAMDTASINHQDDMNFAFDPIPSGHVGPKNEFEAYLHNERYRRIHKFEKIIETIAERYGMAADEWESSASFVNWAMNCESEQPPASKSTLKTRRIKPFTMPTKSIQTATVRANSSLSQELTQPKASKITSRQVDLPVHPAKPGILPSCFRKSDQEAAPAIVSFSTPPRRRNSNSGISLQTDPLVILETPPKAQGLANFKPEELKEIARKLFCQ